MVEYIIVTALHPPYDFILNSFSFSRVPIYPVFLWNYYRSLIDDLPIVDQASAE